MTVQNQNPEIGIVVARLGPEEKFKSSLYDDATDLPVKAPVGNASIGFGCNVQAGWSLRLAKAVLLEQVLEISDFLLTLGWYQMLDAVRRSVLLDIAFNDGVAGLVNGYPKMIAAIKAKNWAEAAVQCNTSNPRLAARYANLAQILLTGQVGGVTLAA